ncbi:MAG: MBL fold metallo-hydrolase [Candidatus Hodarchaeota archaeon]
MKLDRISKRVYANTEGETGGNVGVIILKDSAVAIDAQFPVSGADFRSSISSITEKSVSHLLLTHYHPDHVFGNQAFEDCEIVAHRLLKEKMEDNLKTGWTASNLKKLIEGIKKDAPERAWLFKGLRIVLPTKTFDDHFELDGVKMIHTGGHTAGSSIILVEEDRLLFAGDIIFAKSFPWAGDPTSNPDTWIQTFRRILDLDIDTIVPGHGPVCDKSEVKIQLDWFEGVKDEMKKLIREGRSVEEAIRHDGYPSFYKSKRPEWKENSLRHFYAVWSG